ncbi:MAG: DUF1015 domain-containing protein [Pseudomonadota bacterium]|nr:DUF1015 domain-containing protein [Desulfobacterales bacterium]MBL7101773.1 DUF1015 domain-containing protein [Desulfobacteraceae bacterium]MBL7172595.1 DUF1015 domain-containing protein [Desulfobacteraceae bacterium]
MAIVAPFKGLIYDFHRIQNLSSLVAPPYDVISQEEQDAYYQADPHNVIRLILGKKKIGDSDWDNVYTRAADYFQRWQSDRTFIRTTEPSLYITSMTYDPGTGDPERIRWGIIALVRIEDQGSGVILPHEKTFSAHRDDRLKLYRACNAQFSQIFGLYEDPDNTILNACREALPHTPQMDFTLENGTRHRLWILNRKATFNKVSDAMSRKSIFIADGHHRYETSRNYRDIMRARFGQKPANRSYEFVMMYLSNMSDEGLTILPSHRLLKKVSGFQPEPFFAKVGKWFDIKKFPFTGQNIPQECADLKQGLEQEGQHRTAFGLYMHSSDHYLLFSLKPGVRPEMGEDLHPSLRKLDVLVLSRFIFQKGFGFSKDDLDDEEIFQYQSNMSAAVSEVKSGKYQMVFLLNPTKIGHVKEVAGNSLVMPRKSTYFYPKVLTGLVLNKIDPYEIIQVP